MRKSRKRTPARRKPPKRKRPKGIPTVVEYVRKLPRERLVEIVLEQLQESDWLGRALREEILERHGTAGDLIEDARQLVQSTTDTEADFDHRGFAEPVDYAPVHSAFRRLLCLRKGRGIAETPLGQTRLEAGRGDTSRTYFRVSGRRVCPNEPRSLDRHCRTEGPIGFPGARDQGPGILRRDNSLAPNDSGCHSSAEHLR